VSGRIAGPLAIVLVSLSFASGMFLGLAAGYLLGVHIIQQDDPLWQAAPPWIIEIGMAVASFLGAEVTQFKEGVHGYKRKGITWGRVISRMGLAGAVGFIAGMYFGVLMAFSDYLSFHDQAEYYRERGAF